LQESGKAFTAMYCASLDRLIDISRVEENTEDAIRRNNEPDSIKIDERNW
jgi:hypothetical protein